jgi:UDP-3-O-[3-hydroxymyristoyl] glucosamine N-acyltransferase
MKREITCADIGHSTGMRCRIVGDPARVVTHPARVDVAAPDALAFFSKSVELAHEDSGKLSAGAIICTPEAATALGPSRKRTLILVSNPRLAFIRVMRRFFASPRPTGIDPASFIHPDARIGTSIYVGPFTSIGRAVVGEETIIDAGVHIYDRARIGCCVTIKAGAVVGGDGFGFERDEAGVLEDFPHIGGVVVEDNVMIGSASCIDRGALGDTVIGRGSKIDNLVHVAHNVTIENDCLLVAGCVIGGSAVVGARSCIGPNAWITNGVRIGEGAVVTAGAVVTRDVPPGERVTGNFAIMHDRFLQFMRGVR